MSSGNFTTCPDGHGIRRIVAEDTGEYETSVSLACGCSFSDAPA